MEQFSCQYRLNVGLIFLKNGFYKLQLAIENAIATNVPIIMDAEVGPDWGHVSDIDLSI